MTDLATTEPAGHFDAPALIALYAPFGEKERDLAQKLADIHSLFFQALKQIDAKVSRINAVNEPFAAFGIDMGSFKEAREAIQDTMDEDRKLQQMASKAVMQCVGVLDLSLRDHGLGGDERMAITHKAFDLCLAPLPKRIRGPWETYFDHIGLALATTGNEPAPRGKTPRI